MKIHKQEKQFKPLTITFESQEEVDELFAMLNHALISGCVPALGRYSEQIDQFISDKYIEIHNKLDSIIKN